MRKARIRSNFLPGHNDIPGDLPAPSTTRPLLPRSRTARSRHSRSSRSNSSRTSLAMDEHSTDVVVSDSLEPVAGPSSFPLNMDEDYEAGGSLSTNLLKRKGSDDSDIVAQDGSYATMLGDSEPLSSSSSLEGKGKVKELHLQSPDVVVSGSVEPPSSFPLNMDEDNEAGGSLSTSLLKRKRSDSIVAEDGNATTLGDSEHSDLSQPLSSSSLKGKGKAKELHLQTPAPDSPVTITILDTPEKETLASDQKGKNKVVEPRKAKEELLGGYSCPICFSPPSNATLTPCGHICCGLCLFVAVKTTTQRANMMMTPEGGIARCPVCRATIPGWDGKGGGVIGLKARAILTL